LTLIFCVLTLVFISKTLILGLQSIEPPRNKAKIKVNSVGQGCPTQTRR